SHECVVATDILLYRYFSSVRVQNEVRHPFLVVTLLEFIELRRTRLPVQFDERLIQQGVQIRVHETPVVPAALAVVVRERLDRGIWCTSDAVRQNVELSFRLGSRE